MCIYRQLNPRLLVQVGLGLGLLHWANICLIYISNTLLQTQGGSSMKAWGWISMKRSLGDALKNAFEETTMKNMPIDQFRSFKWRNKVQNWNLRKKLSKIGPFGNFDFWSKVNAKSKPMIWSKSIVKKSQRAIQSRSVSGFRVGSWIGCRDTNVILWRGDD